MTMRETAEATHRRRPVREFFAHLIAMPRWQKTVLVLAVVFAGAGLIGQFSTRSSAAATSSGNWPRLAGASHAVDPANASEASPPNTSSPKLAQRLSPSAAHIGLGVLGGFI